MLKEKRDDGRDSSDRAGTNDLRACAQGSESQLKRRESAFCCMRSEEIQINDNAQLQIMESSVHEFTKLGGTSPSTSAGTVCKLLTVGRSGRSRFLSRATSAGAGPAAAEFTGVAVRLSDLNCIH